MEAKNVRLLGSLKLVLKTLVQIATGNRGHVVEYTCESARRKTETAAINS
jgi:hypothetical protein